MEEQPIQNPNASFDGPIPGASLTTEVGNRPWENPPKESSLDTVINNYIRRLQNEEDAMRYGTSISTLVEAVIETAVMEGEHTIDVGVLASPVIVEYLKGAAEVSKIDYKISDIDVRSAREPKKIDNRLLEEVLDEMEKDEGSPITNEIEASAKEIKSSSKGLMTRKNKDDKDGI